MDKEDAVSGIIKLFPERLKNELIGAAEYGKDIQEIRLRTGKPVCFCRNGETLFIRRGRLAEEASPDCVILRAGEAGEVLSRISGYSIYSRQSEITEGYFTVGGGHRVGVCSTAIGGGNVDFGNVSSINIRIAREHIGCAAKIIESVTARGVIPSVLFAGTVLSGKTTILRDFIRTVSSAPFYKKAAIIDERKELAAVSGGIPSLDVGLCTDVLDGYARGRGIDIAVRTLSPDIIACDEIGTDADADADALRLAALSGITVAATAHAGNREELLRKKAIKRLMEDGIFEYIVFLGNKKNIGIPEIIIRTDNL